MYEKELQNLGLSEKEAKVYITSLELGPDTVQNISKQSGINRATTYVQIDTLKSKGLMSEFDKGKKTYFVAESPNRLKNLLSVIEKELEMKKNEISSALPGLVSMFEGMGERPKVRFFEGVNGVKEIRKEFLMTKAKLAEGFVNFDKLPTLFQNQQDEHTKLRVAKKIQTRMLYVRKYGPLEGYSSPKLLRTAKHIKSSKATFLADITMYENKTIFVSYKDNPIGAIIESKEITDTLRSIFYLLWDNM